MGKGKEEEEVGLVIEHCRFSQKTESGTEAIWNRCKVRDERWLLDSIKENGNRNILDARVLSIEKPSKTKLGDGIGNFFWNHNYVAYEFQSGTPNIDTIHAIMSFVYDKLSEMPKKKFRRSIKDDNSAVFILSKNKPEDLIRQLEESKFSLKKVGEGIYAGSLKPIFMQVIVVDELGEADAEMVESLRGYMGKKW